MQPMKPDEVDRILKTRPDVKHEHIREYESLLAARLNVNPHLPRTDADKASHERREQRLKDLHRQLFG
jgi:hypothetical protein